MPKANYEVSAFSCLPGWDNETGLAEALSALADCLPALQDLTIRNEQPEMAVPLAGISGQAKQLADSGVSESVAKAFFEQNFRPHRIIHAEQQGLLTGYYEPVLRASRVKSPQFSIPLYGRPPDLVDIDGTQRLEIDGQSLTHARSINGQLVPYASRREIESGCLAEEGLEIAYLSDRVDAFFLHVQGSGLLEFSDSERFRFGYDGKNGHPYTSIGQLLIHRDLMSRDEMNLQKLGEWLREEPERGREVMWSNNSFVFFKEVGNASDVRPTGVYDIPLTAGRSLAIDQAYHQIGLPIYVVSNDLEHAPWCAGSYRRLMIAQDVGSAIVGLERGDIYYGSGEQAGICAGMTKNSGNFFVLLPKQLGPQ